MKILFLVSDSFPNGLANARRTRLYADGLAVKGESIVIVTHSLFEIDKKRGNEEEGYTSSGVFYKYSPFKSPSTSNSLFSKVIRAKDRLFNFVWILNSLIKSNDIDIVVCYFPFVIFQALLLLVCHFKGIICVKELNEIPFYNDKFISRVKRFFVLRMLRFYNVVICISDQLQMITQRFVSAKTDIVKIPIIIKPSCTEPQQSLNDSAYDFQYIIHAGSMSETKDGILGILQALQRINDSSDIKIHLKIAGNQPKTSDYYRAISFINSNKLDEYVHFLGYLSDDDLQVQLKGALCTIINKYDTLQNRYCFSTKLAEYMNTGVPVIITNVGEAMNYVNSSNSIIVEPGNIEQICDAVNVLNKNRNLRSRIIANAFATVQEHFDYSIHTSNLYELLESKKHEKI